MVSDHTQFEEAVDLPPWITDALAIATGVLVVIGMVWLAQRSFLLFHSLAEFVSIAIAWGVFGLAWGARRYRQVDNGYLLILGVSSLFAGGIDLVHTLAYKGMGVFSAYDANLPTQLWISARYLQSLSLLAASVLLFHPVGSVLKRPRAPYLLLFGYAIVTALLLAACFGRVFPTCYIEGMGLTPFKRLSEYIISAMLFASLLLLWRQRARFDPHVLRWLSVALAATILAELAFTFYVSVYGFSNMLGHLFKILAFYALYRAIVLMGIQRPQALLFRALQASEAQYRHLADNTPDYIMRYDRQHRHVYANEAAIAAAGRTRAEYIGKTHREMGFPEALCELWERAIDRVFETERPYGEIFEWESAYGTMALDWRVTPEFSDGKIETALAVSRDITALHQKERALREHEAELAAIYENAPIIMMLVDADRRVQRVNGFAQKFANASVEEMVGRCGGDALRCLNALDCEEGCGFGPQCADCAVRLTTLDTLQNGVSHHHVQASLPFMVDGRPQEIHFLLSTTPLELSGKPMALVSILDITERVRAEEALRESEERFRGLVENAMIGFYRTTPDGRILVANPALVAMLGYPSHQELSQRNLEKDGFEPDYPRLQFKELLEHQEHVRGLESAWHRADGSRIFVRESARAVRDPQGKILYYEGTVEDITERVQAEEALRQREQQLTKIFDILPIGLWFADKEGTLLMGNPAGVRIWGAEPHVGPMEYGVFRARRLLSGEEIAPDDWALAHTIREGATIRDELLEIDAFDGQKKIILNYTAPVLDARGEVEGAVVVNLDITDRIRAEEALRESEERYRAFIDGTSDMAFLKDERARYIVINHALAAFFGRVAEDVLGRTDDELMAPEAAEQCRQSDQRALQSGAVVMAEEPLGERVFETLKFAVPLQNGKVGVGGYVRDITARKQAEQERERLEEQLRQAQKMDAIGRLAGGVAHDFNNMLQTILGYTQLALEETPPESGLHEYLSEIQNAGQRSANLTRQLLGFARKQTISPRELNLNDTVEGMLRMLSRLVGENIALSWKPGPNLGIVLMDPSQVDQVLANLVVNARDAIGGASGHVIIETGNVEIDATYQALRPYATPGSYVTLAVSDDGCGMDSETLDKLFDPFFTTKPVGEGTGLGLPTVYGIVKQNNGFINVYSEVGQGSTFRIYLPRVKGVGEAATPATAPQPTPRGVETVLLVEDEGALLTLASRLLRQLGYTVLEASSPELALHLAETHAGEIHLLMTDMVMPQMNGRALAEQIRALRPAIKCLYMSGYAANAIAHRGVVDEGAHFLQKPFALQTLAIQVRAALER